MKNLPAMQTVLKAISYVARHIMVLLKASVVWLAIYAFFTLFTYFSGVGDYLELDNQIAYLNSLTKPDVDALDSLTIQFEEQQRALGSLVTLDELIGGLIQFLAYVSVSVAWFRFYLLAEKPPRIRFGAVELKFSLYMAAYAAAIALYIGLIYRIFDSISAAMLGIAVILGTLLFLMVSARLLMVLPGVAVGDKRMNPKFAWRLTKKNSLDIYGGILLIILAWIPIVILKAIFDDLGLPIFIGWPVQLGLNIIWLALLVSFTSVCYQYFVPRPEAGDLN